MLVLRSLVIAIVAAVIFGSALAHEDDALPAQLVSDFGYIGTVDFPITCASSKVQTDFNYAVAQYSHMSYETARAAFARLLGDEPNCAMAYWGIAMTYTAPVWPMTPTEEVLIPGSQAVARARQLAAELNLSRREELYIEAVGALYDEWEKVDYSKRLERWLKAQEAVYQAYPDDDEAAALYALALVAVGDSRANSDFSYHHKAGSILESVFAHKPEHPGAIHYAIHAYDKPPLAEKAIPMARAYAKIAPDMPHANHMPTHIFTRLGMWKDSKTWNERARDAAMKVKIDGRLYAEYLHATDYLVYAHLQTGHDGLAEAAMLRIGKDGPHQQNFVAAYALAAVPARLALERGDWARAAKLDVHWDAGDSKFDWSGFGACVAVTHFARGIGAALSEQLPLARQELETLEALHKKVVATDRPFWGRRIEVQMRAVEACIMYADGKFDLALDRLRRAANKEDQIGKHPVMPGVVLPIRELYADLCMEQKRYAAALVAYEQNLKSRPGRLNSTGSAGRAAELLGRREEAEGFYRQILEVARQGDTTRTHLDNARAFLGT